MTARPHLSRRKSRLVDQRAIQEYGMSGLVLMENAGRGCSDVLCELGIRGPVVICCGGGNNAGDGFVIARHLDIRGYEVRVLMWSDALRLAGDAAHNYAILTRTDVALLDCRGAEQGWTRSLAEADWIVDALLGTGARGEPRPPIDRAIQALNAQSARKLAVDVPSGLDCDSGQVAQTTFRADHTCTFVAPKQGFSTHGAAAFLGQIHIVDIGVPRKLLAEIAGSPVA